MPIYEYRCKSCGHQLEALQKVDEGALRKCPECGALKLKRLVSAPSFRLKGTGWYETDFKKSGKKKPAESGDAKPADTGDQKADQKSDKKDGAEGGKDSAAAKPESDAKADKTPAAKSDTGKTGASAD